MYGGESILDGVAQCHLWFTVTSRGITSWHLSIYDIAHVSRFTMYLGTHHSFAIQKIALLQAHCFIIMTYFAGIGVVVMMKI